MAREYGATGGFFPVDAETIADLKSSGRDTQRVKLVEAYAKAQGLWRTPKTPEPVFTDTPELDLSTVEPSLAGPTRPDGRVPRRHAAPAFKAARTGFSVKEHAPDFRPRAQHSKYELEKEEGK